MSLRKAHISCAMPAAVNPTQDKERPEYEHGVACHQCADETTEADKDRFRERQKQIRLARERGEQHMVGYDGN